MATKSKTPKNVTIAPEKPARLKKDGTPWRSSKRRPSSVILAELTEKRAKFVAHAAAYVTKLDRLIAKHGTSAISGEEAVAELGMSADELAAMEAKIRKARKALAANPSLAVAVASEEFEGEANDESDDE